MTGMAAVEDLARSGKLYPSTVLYGATQEARLDGAVRIARILLCDKEEDRGRDGCDCRQCGRIVWPRGETFHPDFHVLERDLRTSTSAEGARALLRNAQFHPFEAGAQVFLVVEADTLTDEAASALLKVLEEPPRSAPRNFLLLCPSADTLLPTIRSRSMSVYLGSAVAPDSDDVNLLADGLCGLLNSYADKESATYLLASAQLLLGGLDWDDLRSGRPWSASAGALVEVVRRGELASRLRAPVLDLAADLLEKGPLMRVRNVPAQRILEGLVSKHLGRL